jgi:hypothetical protein
MKDIKVVKTKDEVIVDVKLSSRGSASDPMISVSTADIISHLEKENISFHKIKKQTRLNNYSQNSVLEGQWVFKLSVEKPKKVTKAKTTTTRRRSAVTKTTQPKETHKLLRTEDLERVPPQT